MQSKDKLIESSKNNLTGRTEYRVKGTDGWTLVTNDKSLAVKESRGKREFGSNRVHY